MFKKILFFILILSLSLISFLPLVSMLISTFSDGNLIDIFDSTSLLKSFQKSLFFSLFVASLTTVTGVALGLVLAKTKLPYSKLFATLLTIPLLIPPYIVALGWFELVGRSELLFGFFGTFLVHFCIYLPIPLLLTILFLKQIDPKYENAARVMSSWSRVLREITLPLIYPSIILSFLFVFILSFGEYSVANFFRYKLFSLESFVEFSAFYDFKSATALSLPLVIAAVVLLLSQQYFLEKNRFKFDSTYEIEYIDLGVYKKYLLLFLILFTTFILSPILTLFIKAVDADTFLTALKSSYEPLFRSLSYSFLGATFLTVFGFLSAYMIEQNIFKIGYIFESSLIALFALPSTIIGISLILFFNTPYTNFIYTTPLIIIFGYICKYLALSTKIAQIKLAHIPNSMSEAATILGASWWHSFRYITFGLSKKTLVTVWLIAFIFTLRENTITMLVYPAGLDTLPIYIVTQMANGKSETIAALSVIMIVASLMPMAFFAILIKGKN
jgi:iron(III) transport system permease protein